MGNSSNRFEAGESTDPLTLEALIFQGVGAASVCWTTPEGAGIFDSEQAKAIGDDMLDWINARYVRREGVDGDGR